MKQPASFVVLCQSLHQGFRAHEAPPTYGCLRFVPVSAHEELRRYLSWLAEHKTAAELKGIVNRARGSGGKLETNEAELFVKGTLIALIASWTGLEEP